jgi:hypothetical protein
VVQGKWDDIEVSLPRGIVIPWIIDNQVWGINVRDIDWKEGRGSKYKRAAGSRNAIYRIQQVTLGSTVVMVETELDALIIEQVSCDAELPIISLASGSIHW